VNYYERHLGDYAKDTGHLSMLEHGAYTLLLDRYYSTECGIPADQAYRVARARTDEEKAAVDAVLSEFFTLNDGVWTKGRVQEEIESARHRIETARANGKTGGRPKKNPEITQRVSSGFDSANPTDNPTDNLKVTQKKALQSPISNLQLREEPPTPKGGVVQGLDLNAWDRWISYRADIRKPLKQASIPAAQRKLAALGSDQAAAVENSIANGWTGLFTPIKPVQAAAPAIRSREFPA